MLNTTRVPRGGAPRGIQSGLATPLKRLHQPGLLFRGRGFHDKRPRVKWQLGGQESALQILRKSRANWTAFFNILFFFLLRFSLAPSFIGWFIASSIPRFCFFEIDEFDDWRIYSAARNYFIYRMGKGKKIHSE